MAPNSTGMLKRHRPVEKFDKKRDTKKQKRVEKPIVSSPDLDLTVEELEAVVYREPTPYQKLLASLGSSNKVVADMNKRRLREEEGKSDSEGDEENSGSEFDGEDDDIQGEDQETLVGLTENMTQENNNNQSKEEESNDSETDEEHELSTNGQSFVDASCAFSEHLNHKLSSEELIKLPKGKWKFKWEAPAFDMPNCSWEGTRKNFLGAMQSDATYGLKPKLFNHWLQLYNKAEGRDFESSKRRRFFSICNSYLDILHSNKKPFYNGGPEEDASAMDAYLMHSLNHIFKTRDLVKKNDKIAKHQETAEEEILSDDTFLDQGFTRPKVLIILPMKSIAYRVIKRLIHLTPESMAHFSDPNFQPRRARNDVNFYQRRNDGNQGENDQDYEASAASAIVAVNLLSSARVILKLDNAYSAYSAQYLVDHACPKKEAGQGETDHHCSKLTAKHFLEFVFKERIPKGHDWPHLGSMFKPPSSYNPARVCMKGDVIEPENLDEALKFFLQQQIGARLHVFSPELDDHVGEKGISSDGTRYVGLRDVMVVAVKKIKGEQPVATVELYYNKKVTFVKVALDPMFLPASLHESQGILVNRSNQDAEENFFLSSQVRLHHSLDFQSENVALANTDSLGVPQLGRKLNQILVQHMNALLPNLKSRISNALCPTSNESYGYITVSKVPFELYRRQISRQLLLVLSILSAIPSGSSEPNGAWMMVLNNPSGNEMISFPAYWLVMVVVVVFLCGCTVGKLFLKRRVVQSLEDDANFGQVKGVRVDAKDDGQMPKDAKVGQVKDDEDFEQMPPLEDDDDDEDDAKLHDVVKIPGDINSNKKAKKEREEQREEEKECCCRER